MTEPEYVYIKGQGWVLQLAPSIVFTNNYGIKFRLTNREPKSGERFYNNHLHRAPGFYTPEFVLNEMKTGLMYMQGQGVKWDDYSHSHKDSPYNIVVEIL